MKNTLTIAEIAKKYQKDHSTVLRWVERNLFPNARLEASPAGSYWLIPVSDTDGFDPPKPGRKKTKGANSK
jgi:hypothetical protein